MKFLIPLCILTTFGIMTSEISEKLDTLRQITLKVEIFNLFPDLPQSTYTWHKFPEIDYTLSNTLIQYKFSDLFYNSQKYWEIITFLKHNSDLSTFPKLDWDSFQIFLIHSTSFALFTNFHFSPEDCCEILKFGFKSYSKRIFIQSHPLERIGSQEVHSIFIQTLKNSSFFDQVHSYENMLDRTHESLKPIIVRSK